MDQIPENCWEWNGYLGTCIKYHPAQWWQYVNVYSILTVVVVSAVAATIVVGTVLMMIARSK